MTFKQIEIPDDALWDDFETAAYFNIHPNTLRRWRVQGKGPPHVKIEGAVRHIPDVVRKYARDRSRKSTSDDGQSAWHLRRARLDTGGLRFTSLWRAVS